MMLNDLIFWGTILMMCVYVVCLDRLTPKF